MLKIIPNHQATKRAETYVRACDMKPLQVGQIDDPRMAEELGRCVMRTAAPHRVEIMDLSEPGIGMCWTADPTFRVRLLRPDEPLIIELRNE